jgi:hypothetical protein
MIVTLSLIATSTTEFASLVAKTSEELLEESDVLIIGNIMKASGRTFERVTDYTISVEKYLKNDLNQQTIEISSSGKKDSELQIEDESIFETGDRVLLYLNKQSNSYVISPYSTVLENGENYEIQTVSSRNLIIIVGSIIIAGVTVATVYYLKIKKRKK